MLFLALKLDTKEGIPNARTRLHIFIKFIKKKIKNKNSEIADERKWVNQKKKINLKLKIKINNKKISMRIQFILEIYLYRQK